MNRFLTLSLAVLTVSCGTGTMPESYGPVPSKAQLAWQKMETNMFCHFGPNTFTGEEWGSGKESEDLFNPSALDCNQWVAVASQAGLKGLIITAKHHDGFCLWPSPYSTHTVAQSAWRDGKGDVLRELSEACAATDGKVRMGVYISPWDRNAPEYGTLAYNEVFRATIDQVHSTYGDIFEQWFDGANGEGPNGRRQDYDWPLFNSAVLSIHPNAVIFSDVGPGCRWVGNERGVAGRTNWSRLDVEGFAPGAASPSTDTLNCGNVHGACWVPAEVDVSIRPGWFWRASEQPKTVAELMDIYYSSVGRNALLLLNIPPDDRGLIAAADSAVAVQWRAAIDDVFSTDLADGAHASASSRRGRHFDASCITDGDYDSFWAPTDRDLSPSVELRLPEPKMVNRVLLQEYIPLGQRVSAFHIDVLNGGEWKEAAKETTIGYKRIVKIEPVQAEAVRVVIDSSYALPLLNNVSLHMDNEEYRR